jgi:parallel beta-helix repeat protein
VVNTNNSGPGSLRQAILDASASAGANLIAFDVGGGGVQTIRPASDLPTITRPVTIDGTTQPGYAGAPLIVLDGRGPANGLRITAGDSTVEGLAIGGFGNGILLQTGGGNVIARDFLGTDATGAPLPNENGVFIEGFSSGNTVGGATAGAGNLISGDPCVGVFIRGGSSNNVVQGNLISGYTAEGVLIYNADGNALRGNVIGTDATGTVPRGGLIGVYIYQGSNNTVGGTAAGAGNLISGNTSEGVVVDSGSGNLVAGNRIGTDGAGAKALANGFGVEITGTNNTVGGTVDGAGNLISGNRVEGVDISGSGNVVQGNRIGTDAAGVAPLSNRDGVGVSGTNNTVGGTAAGAGNLISGNRVAGVGLGGSGNVVQGNRIGTDAAGVAPLSNGTGVLIGSNDNTVGGTADGAGNLLSGNTHDGISIVGCGNVVQGNRIGTDATGTAPLGNGTGVGITVRTLPPVTYDANDNTVGGAEAGAGNVIAFNASDGVLVDRGIGNAIQGNAIFGNGNLGIELLHGGNNGQPAPTLTAAASGGGLTTVQGAFTGLPSTTYTLELFANSDPAGGQGERFLASLTVTTDADGVASFSVSLGLEVPAGAALTATLTDPDGNTSPFSLPVVVTS